MVLIHVGGRWEAGGNSNNKKFHSDGFSVTELAIIVIHGVYENKWWNAGNVALGDTYMWIDYNYI